MSESETAKQVQSSKSNSRSEGSRNESSSDLGRLLDLRRQMKSHAPEFRRFESWRYVRIHEPWRKPKGVDNHTRLSVKGWPPLVKVGYRGPRKVRGLHPSGYHDVLVHNLAELEALSPALDAARLSGDLGRKKKIQLVKRAKELKVRVLNGRRLLIEEKVATSAKEQKEEEKREESEKKKRRSRSSK